MCWFLVILLLSLTYGSVSETSQDEKLPSAVVIGTVYCDTCFQQGFSAKSHFISAATVAVECKAGNSIPNFKKEVKTNEHGEFKVQLPFKVRKHAKRIKGCTFKLISSSEPHCAVASAATSSSMSLTARKHGEHIFSAGLFSFKPTKKPNFCNQKQSVPNSKAHGSEVFKSNLIESSDKKSVEDTIVPPIPFLPPLPSLPPIPFLPPLPSLPPIPFLPPLPSLPPISFLPPIPFLPPLPSLPPIPFLPPLPLPPLPPNPLLPSNPLLPPQIPNPLQPGSPPPLIPNPV